MRIVKTYNWTLNVERTALRIFENSIYFYCLFHEHRSKCNSMRKKIVFFPIQKYQFRALVLSVDRCEASWFSHWTSEHKKKMLRMKCENIKIFLRFECSWCLNAASSQRKRMLIFFICQYPNTKVYSVFICMVDGINTCEFQCPNVFSYLSPNIDQMTDWGCCYDMQLYLSINKFKAEEKIKTKEFNRKLPASVWLYTVRDSYEKFETAFFHWIQMIYRIFSIVFWPLSLWFQCCLASGRRLVLLFNSILSFIWIHS